MMMRYLLSVSSLVVLLHVLSCFSNVASQLSWDRTVLTKEPHEHYYIGKNMPPAVITCQTKNAAKITYKCMDSQIPDSSVKLEDVSEDDPSLIQAKIEVTRADVHNQKVNDTFTCTCSAVDFNGQVADTSRKAYVHISHLKRTFTQHPTNTTATEGENAELSCGPPDGQPKPVVTWKKNSKQMHEKNSTDKYVVSDKGNLIILAARKKDSGRYTCVATNMAGKRESKSAYLVVMDAEESLEPGVLISTRKESDKDDPDGGKPRTTRQSIKTHFISEPDETNYITQDRPLLLHCGAVAADILTFSCNGKRVQKDQQTVTQGLDADGNRNIQGQLKVNYSEVEAFNMEFGDSQTYQCICNAWFLEPGNSSAAWSKLDSRTDRGYVILAFLENVFEKDPSDVTVQVGANATLTCEPPRGQPVPQVHWYKEGNRLDTRSKYITDSNGHLVIRNVQAEDAGLYSCVAQNLVKSVQSRVARLIVAELPASTTPASPGKDAIPDFPSVITGTPVLLQDLKPEYSIESGGTETIVCASMSADQMTIDCGGKRLSTDEYELQTKMHRESGKRLLYGKAKISADTVAEKPDYYCQCVAWYINDQNAWEKLLGTKASFKVVTSRVYIGDKFLDTPKDTEVYLESDAEFDCKPPEGNPVPSVHWLKDGVQIDPFSDSNFVISSDGKLYIEYIRNSDDGMYVCVANNEAGTLFSPAAKLTIIDKHQPTPTDKVDPDRASPEETTDHDHILTQPIFSLQPNPENYIIKDMPVNLTCSVIAANLLLFVCNGEALQGTALTATHYQLPNSHSTIHENSLVITKEKVQEHEGVEPYTCTCRAYYQKVDSNQVEFVDSASAVIQVAFLNSNFLQEPTDTQVSYLGRAELKCTPPRGTPVPKVYWVKDGYRLSENEKRRVEDTGNLIIDKFNTDDQGSYTCVAESIFRSRTSQTAIVKLADETATKSDPHTDDVSGLSTSTEQSVDAQQKSVPHISLDLHPVYDIVENKPVTLVCGAVAVETITITCGNQNAEDLMIKERMQEVVLSNKQVKLVKAIEASISVSKSDVESFGLGNDYYCQCQAHYLVPEERDYKVIHSSKGIVRAEKNEFTDCADLLLFCSNKLPHSAPDTEFCVAIPEYSVCIHDYLQKCSQITNRVTLNEVKMAFKEAQTRCLVKPKCPEVDNCYRALSDTAKSELTVQSLCVNGDSIIHCVDKALTDCNTTLSPLEQKARDNMIHVIDWFTLYCYKMFQVNPALSSCETMDDSCNKYAQALAKENATNWCKFMSPFVECTTEAVDACGLDELRRGLQEMYTQSTTLSCSVTGDEIKEPDGDQSTEIKPELEIDKDDDTESNGESEKTETEDLNVENYDNKDDGDNTDIKKEAATAAKNEGLDSSSPSLFAPLALVTILQLLMMMNMVMTLR